MLKNLKNLRKEFGISQKEIAEQLNISQQTYSDYENDKTEPTMELLIKLAEFFKITVDELIGYEGLTAEEYAAGARETKKISITPIEDDMLYAFREVGKKLGEKGQRALIDVAEGMAGIK